jgi:WD40 repeat protein
MALSPDGKLLAAPDGNGTVRLWNPATGQPVGTPLQATSAQTGPNNMVAVAYSPNGQLLASAGGDGTVRLWNPATGQPVGTALQISPNSVDAVAFSPNGQLLASAQVDGTVRLLRVSLFTDPYEALCTDVGSPTPQDWHQYAAGEPQPQVCA